MKRCFFLLTAFIVLISVLCLTGCGGGSKSHTVRTPWDGTVAGVDTRPYDSETNVAVTTWIRVFWPDYYFEPSQTFTFSLQKDTGTDWVAVRTIDKDSYPENGEWWFAPENNLDYNTDYRIIIKDDYNNQVIHYFTTQYASRAVGEPTSKGTIYLPAGGGKSGGTAAEEHVIRVPGK